MTQQETFRSRTKWFAPCLLSFVLALGQALAWAAHPSGIIQAAPYGRGVYEINLRTTLTDSQAPSPTHKETQQ